MDTSRISKRDHRAQGRSNLHSINNQNVELVKRQAGPITDLLKRFCKEHPQHVLCRVLLPTPPKNSNQPRTTATPARPTTPATQPQKPTPAPNPTTNNPVTTPQPSPTTSVVVNPPATTSNATPQNTMSGTSLGTSDTSSIVNTSQTVSPIGAPTSNSPNSSDPPQTTNNAADTITTGRGGTSNQSTAGPQISVPFGTDPSLTVGVGNNNLPGSATGLPNTAAATAGANAGPIIGGILGAVFFILIILATLVWLRQKRNRANRVAPSSEFMGANGQYPFAGGVQAQGQHARLSNPETRTMSNAASIGRTDNPRTIFDIRRGV